jgi:asparagine synthase (glutamine-hydrolysing)
MCGFASIIGMRQTAPPPEALERMLKSIFHRGPDDDGRMVDGSVAFGFRRLSILDLSPAGHQPMYSPDGVLTIVFNGEIYNYLELREELCAFGHQFRSSGDTEVLLAAYRQWGQDCVTRLNGMWAFLIMDRSRRCLFGARDRFGMKPLYTAADGQYRLFASEIKAIRASGLHHGRLNLSTCASFLHESRLDDTDETFFEGIAQIPAGHALECAFDGTLRTWPYWQIEGGESRPHHGDIAGEFAHLFESAVRVHMRSDVPVGINLSGGLDSTSILCAAARVNAAERAEGRLLAFCYFDAAHDESTFIEATLRQTGAQLVRLQLTPEELWDSLPEVLGHQDEPVHAMSAVVGFHLMRLARDHGVKVVLNGQGADELLAGYSSYFHERWCDLVRVGHWVQARNEIERYAQAHGGAGQAAFRAVLSHVIKSPLHHLGPAALLRRRSRSQDAIRRDWLRPELAANLPDPGPPPIPSLRPALERSVRERPLPLFLRVEDRNAMANSVEARLPFLDIDLVSFASSLPDEWKIRGPWNKYVLREGMRDQIPEVVRSRLDKMGFPTSAGDWLRSVLYSRAQEVLGSREMRDIGFFDVPRLHRMLELHRLGQGDYGAAVFAAAQFCMWYKATR